MTTKAKRVQVLGGPASALSGFTGRTREIIVDTTDWAPTVHDGATPGGHKVQMQTGRLSALLGLGLSADKLVYATGADAFAATDLTPFSRALLAGASSAAMRTTLGLGSVATQAASSIAVTGGTIDGATVGATTPAAGRFTTLAHTGDVVMGAAGTVTVRPGNPTGGPGGNAFDGGILTQFATGDYQVVSYQLVATSGRKPTWGPRGEFVVRSEESGPLDYNRNSFNALADYFGPLLNDPATGFSINQEAGGNYPRRQFFYRLQHNDTRNQYGGQNYVIDPWHVDPDGHFQFFRRTDAPCPTADNFEVRIGTTTRGFGPVLTSAGTQHSPALRMWGHAHDGAAQHQADWRTRVVPTSSAGASKLVIDTRKDSAPYMPALTVTDGGVLNIAGLTFGTGTAVLNDYETDRWTPTLRGLTTAGSNTYATQDGFYVRIGNMVHVSARVEISSKDVAMAGAVAVGGLPFAPIANGNSENAFSISRPYGFGYPAGRTQMVAHNDPGQAYILLQACGNSVSQGSIDSSGVSSAAGLIISGSYRIP